MSTTQHPLTDGAIAGIWTKYTNALDVFSYTGRRPSSDLPIIRGALRAAFDAGREYERTTTAEPLARTILAVPEGHGAPHHDAGRIKPGDFVMEVDDPSTFIRAGIAHHQDRVGDWLTKDGRILTWAVRRADRPDAVTVWPAPTPPAVEVHWEPQFGDVIRGVEAGRSKHERLAYLGRAFEDSENSVYPDDITAFTLPDGTRARRDGEHENGEPRFVKTQEGEK